MRCLDLRVLLCLFFPIQFKFPDGSYSESPFPASARIFCITRLPQVDFRILLLSCAHHSMDPWHKVARIFEVPWIWWLYKRVFCGFRLYGRCDKEKPPCADAVQSWKYLLLGHHLHEAGFLGVHENGWLGSAPCAPCGTFLKDNDGRVYLIDTVLDVKDRSISQFSKFWEVLICILPCPTAVLGVGEGSRDRKVIVGGGLSPFWIIYTGSAVAVHYEVSTTYFPAVDSWTFVHLGTNWVFFQTGADQKLMNFADGIESFWYFFGAPPHLSLGKGSDKISLLGMAYRSTLICWLSLTCWVSWWPQRHSHCIGLGVGLAKCCQLKSLGSMHKNSNFHVSQMT